MRRAPLLLLTAATIAGTSATACRADEVFSLMSDSTFVNAMRELRRLPVGVYTDQSARALMRDSILAKYSVTGAELESTAVWLARDPAKAVEVWRAVESDMFSPP